MFIKGITKKDIKFILDCLYYNRHHFRQIPSDECFDKQEALNKMKDIEYKLKEVIKNNKVKKNVR